MARAKVAISLDENTLGRLDRLVKAHVFPSRSQAIQEAVEEKLARFEQLAVPVDIYAVGSSLLDNHGPTVSDFTADVVRVKIEGEWRDLAKVGRRACDNPDLEPVA